MVIALISPLGLCAQGTVDIVTPLESMTDFKGTVSYEVLLPAADDPIVYTVEMRSDRNPADSLSLCDYLIDWSLPTPSGVSKGFSAYFGGHHYRYRDERLQEYHMDWDSIPFTMGRGGVQRNAQFVDILPQYLARELRTIMTDSAYDYRLTPDTLFNGERVITLKARLNYKGYVSKEILYVFDRDTRLPLFAEIDNNPGAISEQTVTIRFNEMAHEPFDLTGEPALIERYPEVFEKYRESSFRVENLPGTPMPAFSAPTTTGERYTHHRGDAFRAPTIIVLLDPAVASTPAVIAALREAVASSPVAVDLVMAFISNNVDAIEQLVPEIHPGEHLLMTARALARDCGVNVYPTVIIAGRDGNVKDVVLGYNKELADIVIQKVALSD